MQLNKQFGAALSVAALATIGSMVAFPAMAAGSQKQSALAIVIWTGEAGDNKFSTAGNWLPKRVPVTGDTLYFTSQIFECAETPQEVHLINDINTEFGMVGWGTTESDRIETDCDPEDGSFVPHRFYVDKMKLKGGGTIERFVNRSDRYDNRLIIDDMDFRGDATLVGGNFYTPNDGDSSAFAVDNLVMVKDVESYRLAKDKSDFLLATFQPNGVLALGDRALGFVQEYSSFELTAETAAGIEGISCHQCTLFVSETINNPDLTIELDSDNDRDRATLAHSRPYSKTKKVTLTADFNVLSREAAATVLSPSKLTLKGTRSGFGFDDSGSSTGSFSDKTKKVR